MNSNTKKAESSKANADTRVSTSKLPVDQRQQWIEVAAYYIAESGGFNSGCDVENWLAAETEIDQLLAEGKL